jgi:hypothetical protein
MSEKYQLEAQYWWAFSCLVLAGRRGPAEFHEELLRRTSCTLPEKEEVEEIMEEALGYLAEVLNSGLSETVPQTLSMTGWKRHLLALSSRPEDPREHKTKILRFFSR